MEESQFEFIVAILVAFYVYHYFFAPRKVSTPSSLVEIKDIPVEETNVKTTDDEECAICLEEETDPEMTKLACGHMFHSDCISDWLEFNTTCPLCRLPNPHEAFE